MITIALQKPILNNIAAFDAENGGQYNFVVTGGDLWLGVKITIKDITTPTNPDITVFTPTQANMGLITADLLTNGNQYRATIQTTTSYTEAGMTDTNTSSASNSILFYCYESPTFEFTNISQDGVITSSVYTFAGHYIQEQGELLSTYQVILYDMYNNELQNSGILNAPQHSTSGSVVSCFPTYTVNDFMGIDDCKIIMYGITTEGTQLSTDLISFKIQRTIVEKYTEIYAINNCDNGNITVGSSLDVVAGISDKSPVTFYPNIDMGTEADLRNNGVMWANVIDVDTFSVFLQFRAPISNLPHLILTYNNSIVSQTIFNISKVYDGKIYNSIIANTDIYDDDGYIIDNIEAIYDVSSQELDNINYTTDAIIYGFMIRRSEDEFTTSLEMLHEPVEALSNHYIYTNEITPFDVSDIGDGDIIINNGLIAVDDGEGNLTISIEDGYEIPIIDISVNGHIVIGKYEDNNWLTALYLSNDYDDVQITFALGNETDIKNIDELEDEDTYLWAISQDETINLSSNNFAVVDGLLYYYPNGRGM